MKKAILTAVVSVGLCTNALAIAQLDWGNGVWEIFDPSDVSVAELSGWAIELYESADNVIGFSAGTPGANENLRNTATWASAGAPGFFSATLAPADPALAAGDFVYTVLYNNALASSATFYTIIEMANGGTTTSTLGPADPLTYDPSVTGGANVQAADWVAVPEPGTMAMFGLGAVIMALRRKLKK